MEPRQPEPAFWHGRRVLLTGHTGFKGTWLGLMLTHLGAHIVGHAGEELINIFGLAKKHGITASQLRDFIYAYPSFSSDIKHML